MYLGQCSLNANVAIHVNVCELYILSSLTSSPSSISLSMTLSLSLPTDISKKKTQQTKEVKSNLQQQQ